jgi:diguanylate cyclase (GGDEF)-like protein
MKDPEKKKSGFSWEKLLYWPEGKEGFNSYRDQLYAVNRKNLEVAALFAAGCYALLFMVGFFNSVIARYRLVYAGLLIICLIMYLITRNYLRSHMKAVGIFYYLFALCSYLGAVYAGVFLAETDRAVLILFDLLLLPVFYYDLPMRSNFMTVLVGLVFLIEEKIFGIPEKFSQDCIYVIAAMLLSVGETSFIRPQILQSFHRGKSFAELAHTDQLTLTYNKKQTEFLASQYISSCSGKERYALIIMDLDNFKGINDTHGHPTGDRVLSIIGRILSEQTRRGDIVGRIGGDEFLFLMKDLRKEMEAKERAEQLEHAVMEESEKEFGFTVSCSMGIAFGSGYDTSYQLLYSTADHALYEAKKSGKGRWRAAEYS